MGFARWMASPFGRGVRIVLGLLLIAWGIGGVGGPKGWSIAVGGMLPLILGIINGCLFAPLLRVPFKGADLPPA